MAFHNNPRIVTDSLLVCLDATHPESYPGSGSTWYDVSGNGHNMTLYNSPTYTQPAAGLSYGITCDGSNDYLQNTSLPGGDKTFSFEIWVYHNGTNQLGSYGIYSGGSNYGPLIYHHGAGMGNGHYFPGSPGGDYPGGNSATTVNLKWTLISHVYKNLDSSSDSYKSYKNGVHVGTQTSHDMNNSGHGRGSNGWSFSSYTANNQYYKGSYGGYRYYNRDLSDDEVKQNFNAQRTRYGL
jgi:hypothetical protein